MAPVAVVPDGLGVLNEKLSECAWVWAGSGAMIIILKASLGK